MNTTVGHSVRRPKSLRATVVALMGVTALSLAACSPSEEKPSEQTASESQTADNAAEGLTFEEAYVGAKGTDKDMTAVFGKLVNNTDKEIHIVSASGSLDAKYELHEVVDGVMQENPDGLRISAGGELELKPGGDHIMIMGYSEEIAAGDDITVTLKAEDGTEYELKNIPARVQQSSHEHYGDAHGDHAGMEGHGDHAGMEDHSEHGSHGAEMGGEGEHAGHGEH
ncbi:copper chaperone PCu(A)C [Corynebacterium urealyticum]|uniref:copper chaperone PCu(A)C n=1 Tax=Corynebacterium urealyticum TaxID=43771 RepID=UPI0011E6FF66|nr:copper chaperone PCu(A)C [Corynebacterium urealyticum]TYR14901.1 copper chaperone PCu(A)C [Corynebacterium urealyticum]TYT21620.1 copper chaperone PCu(A)C [Corynebacterium urealyticum]